MHLVLVAFKSSWRPPKECCMALLLGEVMGPTVGYGSYSRSVLLLGEVMGPTVGLCCC